MPYSERTGDNMPTTPPVLTDEELLRLGDALPKFAAFLTDVREAMDGLKALAEELEQELDMALACLSEDALKRG